MMTFAKYDPAKKQYRMWLYDSLGSDLEFTGTPDDKAKTLTWTATPAEGISVTMVWTFPTDDTFDWALTATNGGKPALEIKGSMKRKK
jgi:hypothetical protein